MPQLVRQSRRGLRNRTLTELANRQNSPHILLKSAVPIALYKPAGMHLHLLC